jgi:hypothetical protein
MPKGAAPSPRSTPLSSSSTTASDNIDRDTAPLWDTSLVSRPRYFDQLVRWLPTQDSRFTTLVQYGVVNDKRYTVVTSTNHLDRHRLGLISRGSFRKPCIIKRTDADSTGFPADVDTTRADEESKYSINHNIISQVDNELLEKILGTIDDEDTVHELREDNDGSGRRLLAALDHDVAQAAADDSGNLGESTRKDIEALLSAGLADTSVRAFNAFKSELSRLIRTLPDDLKKGFPDEVVARHLVQSVKNLGPLIRQQINNEIKHDKAAGDLKKSRDTCVRVLSELEAEEVEEARKNGHANAARGRSDANRPGVGNKSGGDRKPADKDKP